MFNLLFSLQHVGITVSADLFQYETALAAGWDYGARGPVTRAEDTFPKAHLSKLAPTCAYSVWLKNNIYFFLYCQLPASLCPRNFLMN